MNYIRLIGFIMSFAIVLKRRKRKDYGNVIFILTIIFNIPCEVLPLKFNIVCAEVYCFPEVKKR